ncbi:MAG: hypothetical protein MZW92_39770 [Comamonadaceae bacterium]|nr:hypothetical protein [Comamonadaceae bacterium]
MKRPRRPCAHGIDTDTVGENRQTGVEDAVRTGQPARRRRWLRAVDHAVRAALRELLAGVDGLRQGGADGRAAGAGGRPRPARWSSCPRSSTRRSSRRSST